MHIHSLDVANDVDIDRQTTVCTGCNAEFERVWLADRGRWSHWRAVNARSETAAPAVA